MSSLVSQAIDLGVACQPEPEEEMELTVLCLRSTADDVCQVCFCLCCSAVASFACFFTRGRMSGGVSNLGAKLCVGRAVRNVSHYVL